MCFCALSIFKNVFGWNWNISFVEAFFPIPIGGSIDYLSYRNNLLLTRRIQNQQTRFKNLENIKKIINAFI